MLYNGTTYSDNAPRSVPGVLEAVRADRRRIRVWYGNTKTGRAWPEENDVIGRVGRSLGPVKIPILVYNARSTGGPGLLESCIVRIDDIEARRPLYRHPSFESGFERGRVVDEDYLGPTGERYRAAVYNDRGELHSRHATRAEAERLIDFLNGYRYRK